MCPTCCKGFHDQYNVTAINVTLPTARTPDVSPELKEKFEEICRNRGIQKENILGYTKDGKFNSLVSSSWLPVLLTEKSKRR